MSAGRRLGALRRALGGALGRVRGVLMLVLLGALPAQAANYVFPGNLPSGCSGSSGVYACGPLTLAWGDTLTIGTPKPARITFSGNFDTSNAQINAAGGAADLRIIVAGTLTIGYGAVINADLIALSVIEGNGAVRIGGSVTALSGGITLSYQTQVSGHLRSVNGNISTGDRVTLGGHITSNTGDVSLGYQSQLAGGITTSGSVTVNQEVVVGGAVLGAAGDVNVGYAARVGAATATSGKLIFAQASQSAACVRNTGGAATAITLGYQASIPAVCCGSDCGSACVSNNTSAAMPAACSAGIVHVGSSSSHNADNRNDRLTLTRPTSVAAGDLMLAWVSQRTTQLPLSTNMNSVPSGWAVVLTRDNGSSFGTTVYRKVAGSNEASSYTWRFDNDGRAAGGIVAFRGVDTSSPIEASASQLNASSSTYTAPAVTTTNAGTMLVAMYAAPAGDVVVNPPGGMLMAPGATSTGSTGGISSGTAFALQAATGSTGTRSTDGHLALQSVGALVALRPAVVAPAVHHYQLALPASSLSCLPSTVTVTACADASSPCTNPATTVSGETATLATSAGGLGATTLSFNAAGVASTTLTHGAAANGAVVSVTLSNESAAATSTRQCCPPGGSCSTANSCSTSFSTAGFVIAASNGGAAATVPAQTAGTAAGGYVLRAVKTGTSTQACEAALSGAQTVNWGYQCNDPSTCAASNLMTLDVGTTTLIARNAHGVSGSSTAVTMNFDANGNAPFSFSHADVGLVTLFASKTVGGATLAGSSNAFVVKPARFALSAIRQTAAPNTANPGAGSAAGAKFLAAGVAFSATVTAQTSTGATTPSYGRESTPEGVRLTPTLVQPAGGTTGTLANATLAGGSFSNGVATATGLAYSEVGIITLSPGIADGNYLGAGSVTGTASGNVGRFVPAGFALGSGSVTHRSGLACSPASGFSYLDENFRLTMTLTAQNSAGATTANYTGSFAKLDPSVATAWQLAGVAGSTVFSGASGRLSLGSASGSWSNGVLAAATLTAQARRASAPDGPHAASFGVAPVDSDGVAITTLNLATTSPFSTPDRASVASVPLRYGRLRLSSAIGPADRTLGLPVAAQYWDGSAWAANTLDSCTLLPAAALGFGALSGTLTALDTGATGDTTLASGRGTLRLNAPGGGRRGSYNVVLSLGDTATPASCLAAWVPATGDAATVGAGLAPLRGAWCGGSPDKDPAARASFGRASGNNHLVIRQENP